MTSLNTLRPSAGAVRPRKRVGRGPGSGHGKTASRGHKGLKSRSGGKPASGFEGGQMPLQRRLPKRGFTNVFKIVYQIVNITDLQGIEAHTVVTRELLQRMGRIKSSAKPIKILGDGEIAIPLTIQADRFSETAKQKIIAAGGSVEEQST